MSKIFSENRAAFGSADKSLITSVALAALVILGCAPNEPQKNGVQLVSENSIFRLEISDYSRDEVVSVEKPELVVSVWVDDNEFGDEELEHLVSIFPNIVSIDLGRTKITDNAANHLSLLKHLAVLDVYYTEITNSFFSNIDPNQCVNIKKIHASNCHCLRNGVKGIGRFPNLEVLDLSMNSNTSGTVFECLRQCSKLEKVYLSNTSVDGSGEVLTDKARVRELYIAGTLFDNGQVDSLTGLSSLQVLDVSQNSGLTNEAVIGFVDHPEITVLNLSGTSVTYEVIEELSKNKNLRRIYIDDCPHLPSKREVVESLSIHRPSVRVGRHGEIVF